jgi:DNA (cytosine-5)-methyltransferase 1
MKLTNISLFSGALGLDLGLEKADFSTEVCVEINDFCKKTIEANREHLRKPNVPILGDITELSPREILKAAGLKPGEATIVSGGPPCQSFSTAGRRKSIGDPRGSLFKNFIDVVEKAQPRFFIMENVKGVISAAIKHRPLAEREKRPLEPEEELGSAYKVILGEFDRIKYKYVEGILDAVNYGVPQFRERLIIIGSRDHEDIFLPNPTHFMHHQEPSYRWKTLEEAIKDLEPDPGPHGRFSSERAKYLKRVPSGGNWRNLKKSDIPKAMGGAYNAEGGKMGFYRRLHYKQPCPTLVTSPLHKGTMLCHPVFTRPLSVKEYARIQQFPPEWAFNGNLTEGYKQIGNAVPIGLGYAIGMAIRSVINGDKTVEVKRMRGTSTHKQYKQEQK